jgi:RHS repeat-associated protein
VAYSYPAAGSARPHTPSSIGGASYSYDANGNLTGGGGRTYTWNAENLPLSVSQTSGSESYSYDADGERVKVVRGSTTTVYLEGLWEEPVGGAPKLYYSFNGQAVVLYTSSPSAFTYLHSDHLGSVSVATDGNHAVVSQQEYDPWGQVRSGGVPQTALNYTGQRLDGTLLLYYHARLYDPGLGRFVSADSIVPGAASGKGGGAATLGADSSSQLAPLTVDFHEPGFVSRLNGETAFRQQKGFFFQLSDEDKQKAGSPWGPANPQALNRYSYVLNNPMRYMDPTGHTTRCKEIGGVNFCVGGIVTNRSSHDIAVIGDIPLLDAHGKVVRDAKGNIVYQEDVKVILHPGESSLDYNMVDADFIQPYNGVSIDGHDSDEVYKLLDMQAVIVYDNPLTGGVSVYDMGLGWLIEVIQNGINADIGGWRSVDPVNIPKCALNEINDPECTHKT